MTGVWPEPCPPHLAHPPNRQTLRGYTMRWLAPSLRPPPKQLTVPAMTRVGGPTWRTRTPGHPSECMPFNCAARHQQLGDGFAPPCRASQLTCRRYTGQLRGLGDASRASRMLRATFAVGSRGWVKRCSSTTSRACCAARTSRRASTKEEPWSENRGACGRTRPRRIAAGTRR